MGFCVIFFRFCPYLIIARLPGCWWRAMLLSKDNFRDPGLSLLPLHSSIVKFNLIHFKTTNAILPKHNKFVTFKNHVRHHSSIFNERLKDMCWWLTRIKLFIRSSQMKFWGVLETNYWLVWNTHTTITSLLLLLGQMKEPIKNIYPDCTWISSYLKN